MIFHNRIIHLIIFLFIFHSTTSSVNPQEDLDSTVVIPDSVLKISDPSAKLSEIFKLIEHESNWTKIILLSKLAVHIADSNGFQFEKARALHINGEAWKIWGNNFKSTQKLTEALEIFESLDSARHVARVKRSLGETYRATKNYKLSHELLEEALSSFLSLGITTEIAETYNRLAATQYEIAFEEEPQKSSLMEIYNSNESFENALTRYQRLKNEIDTLKVYIQNALNFAEKSNFYEIIISTKIIQAAYFNISLEPYKALHELDNVIILIEKHKLYYDLPLVYLNKARVYSQAYLRLPLLEIEESKKALEIAKQNDIKVYKIWATTNLFESYRSLGNYELAFKYLSEHTAYKDEYREEELELNLVVQKFNYQIQSNQQVLENKKTQLKILIISIVVLLIFSSIFMMILVRKNRKQKKLLEELNDKNRIISDQNKELELSNSEKDKFFSIIAHDLRTPFNSVVGYSDLLLHQLKNNDYKDIDEYARNIITSSKGALELLSNLLYWAKSQSGRMEFKLEKVNLYDIVNENINLLSDAALHKRISLKNKITNSVYAKADKSMLNTVIRNLVSNSIKFTRENGCVEINSKQTGDKVILSVSDNGIGMDPEILSGAFSLDQENRQSGTAGEPSTGLGLMLCKEFIEKNGGTININSKKDIGTEVLISLPIYS